MPMPTLPSEVITRAVVEPNAGVVVPNNASGYVAASGFITDNLALGVVVPIPNASLAAVGTTVKVLNESMLLAVE